jgi:hypothetical protein
MTQTEDRRAKYKAVVDYEIAMTQARFQTLAIFIAAVGFVVGRGHLSRPTAALFLLITVGLWIVDLRNRDVLAKWRSVGRDLEEEMLDGDELDQTLDGWGRLFPPERLGRNKELKLGVFATKHPIKGRMAGVLVHQFGIDVIFSCGDWFRSRPPLRSIGLAGSSDRGGCGRALRIAGDVVGSTSRQVLRAYTLGSGRELGIRASPRVPPTGECEVCEASRTARASFAPVGASYQRS